MYFYYLRELEKLRKGQENFLIPYSSSKNANAEMIQKLWSNGTVLDTGVVWQKAKSKEAIRNWIKYYKENYS